MSKALRNILLALLFLAGVATYWLMGRQTSSVPPLQEAAARGDTAKVDKLLKSGADVNARPPKSRPAIVVATENGKTDTVRLLLQKGADKGTRDEALAIAAGRCDLPTVQLLLSGGADGKSLLKPNASGESPFALIKKRIVPGPSPCADVIRALELSGLTDKPRPKRKR